MWVGVLFCFEARRFSSTLNMWSTEIDFTISRQVYVFRVCASTYMYRLMKFSTYQQLPSLYISIFIYLCSLAETSWKSLKPMCVLWDMSHFFLKRHNCLTETNCLSLKMGCWHILLRCAMLPRFVSIRQYFIISKQVMILVNQYFTL